MRRRRRQQACGQTPPPPALQPTENLSPLEKLSFFSSESWKIRSSHTPNTAAEKMESAGQVRRLAFRNHIWTSRDHGLRILSRGLILRDCCVLAFEKRDGLIRVDRVHERDGALQHVGRPNVCVAPIWQPVLLAVRPVRAFLPWQRERRNAGRWSVRVCAQTRIAGSKCARGPNRRALRLFFALLIRCFYSLCTNKI